LQEQIGDVLFDPEPAASRFGTPLGRGKGIGGTRALGRQSGGQLKEPPNSLEEVNVSEEEVINSPKEQFLLDYHRKHLKDKTYGLDEKGRMVTIRVIGVTGPDGRVYSIPSFWSVGGEGTVGEILSDEDSAKLAARIGWDKFPVHDSPPEHDAAAKKRHHLIEQDAIKAGVPSFQTGGTPAERMANVE